MGLAWVGRWASDRHQATLIRGRRWESYDPARRREQRAQLAFPSSRQAYSAARLPPRGEGRAPSVCHGLPPREIFLQMNLESSAPRLGFAQMDSHWRGWQEDLFASSASGVGLLSADMALPVSFPSKCPTALHHGAGDVTSLWGHKPVWQIALLRPQMPEWLNSSPSLTKSRHLCIRRCSRLYC